jgi:hypothetical protein
MANLPNPPTNEDMRPNLVSTFPGPAKQTDEFGQQAGTPGFDPNSTARNAVIASVDAARSTNARDIATQQGHPSYVGTGFSGNIADRWDDEDSPLSRENSAQDHQFESQFGAHAIGPHIAAARGATDYHNLTARQQTLMDHAHTQVESADFVQKASQIDPNTPDALANWTKLASTHTGASGEMVKAFNDRFFQMHNQHLTMSGKGYDQVIKAVQDKRLSAEEAGDIIHTGNYAAGLLKAAQRTGTKEAGKDEASQQRMYHASLGELKALKAEKSSSVADEGSPEAKALDDNIAWHQGQIDSYIKAHPVSPPKESATPGAKGPSAEFLATAGGTQIPESSVVKTGAATPSAPGQPAPTSVSKYQ